MRPEVRIQRIHTLGPSGTNCEEAARHWFQRCGEAGEVVLHDSLEEAALFAMKEEGSALLGCIVYPDLHRLVFENVGSLSLVDCFVMETLEMVLAARSRIEPLSIATHPAPEALIPPSIQHRRYARSNSHAAELCRAGEVDSCVTTSSAARGQGLTILTSFGRVPMGFSIHASVRS